jgi:hypothetical protein
MHRGTPLRNRFATEPGCDYHLPVLKIVTSEIVEPMQHRNHKDRLRATSNARKRGPMSFKPCLVKVRTATNKYERCCLKFGQQACVVERPRKIAPD